MKKFSIRIFSVPNSQAVQFLVDWSTIFCRPFLDSRILKQVWNLGIRFFRWTYLVDAPNFLIISSSVN
ncbi:MAG TPA: hypothetical protein DD001_05975 [Microcoleaceae bacterium UBA10368]|nr:hypothetical protein [Microcoleaceae cyanobacterium UBA10368]HCV32182.1 hypothetical protein [Microcoleaceae cyanobacterium UBA9251]